jgi:hypothetical protein
VYTGSAMQEIEKHCVDVMSADSGRERPVE